MIEIRRVGTERRPELTATLAAAFAADPFIGWVLAESELAPGQAMDRWWTGALDAMGEVAVLHANQESSAVAVWLPPHDQMPDEPSAEPNAFVELVNGLCGSGAAERLAFFGELARAAPEVPHWHLTAVAVRPDRQGEGLGQRVLAPLLAQCDRQGLPSYLESTTSRSRTLYERLGFDLIEEVVAPGGPELALMWRQPNRDSPGGR